MQTRRHFLAAGAAGLGGAALAGAAAAQYMDPSGLFELEGGGFSVSPVRHASFVMETPESVIHVDPVGGPDLYDGLAEPDLILVTRADAEHFDVETLQALVDVGAATGLVTAPAVYRALPPELRARATALDAFGTAEAMDVTLRAVPAGEAAVIGSDPLSGDRETGFVLSVDAVRVFVPGAAATVAAAAREPALDILFLPLPPGGAIGPEAALEIVRSAGPRLVLPYRYGDTPPEDFARMLRDAGLDTEVRLLDWAS